MVRRTRRSVDARHTLHVGRDRHLLEELIQPIDHGDPGQGTDDGGQRPGIGRAAADHMRERGSGDSGFGGKRLTIETSLVDLCAKAEWVEAMSGHCFLLREGGRRSDRCSLP